MVESGEYIDIWETWDGDKASREEVKVLFDDYLIETFGDIDIRHLCCRNGFIDLFEASKNVHWQNLGKRALKKFFGISSKSTHLTKGRGGNVIFKLWTINFFLFW